MSLWLKQSTAVTVKIGPFVDDTDFKTAETGLTISQADIRLSKNGGNIAQSNNAAGATHDELGQYDVPLDTTDTNTLGTLRVIIAESGALQVWQDFMVVPANVWDSLFGADNLQVDVAQWLGTTAATPTVAGVPEVDVTHVAGSATTATLDSIKAETASILTDTAEIGAAGAGLTNINLPDQTMNITGNITGNLTGSVGSVTGAVGSVTAGVTLAAAAVQAIWDALTSALTTVGSVGKLLVDNVNATVSSRATQTSVDDLPTNAELTTALGTADDAVLAAIAALNNLSAAQVNAEVVDALATDTYAEPGQATPGATATLASKINYLYKAWRNKSDQTATTYQLYGDDATTVHQKATVSDDGVTFTKGEVATGP